MSSLDRSPINGYSIDISRSSRGCVSRTTSRAGDFWRVRRSSRHALRASGPYHRTPFCTKKSPAGGYTDHLIAREGAVDVREFPLFRKPRERPMIVSGQTYKQGLWAVAKVVGPPADNQA